MNAALGADEIYLHPLPGRETAQAVARHAEGGPPGNLWHVLFAFQVTLLPFAEIAKRKWGFNLGVLMEEVHHRQQLFIESQHFPGGRFQDERRRTLALRCRSEADGRRIHLALIGKVCGAQPESAARAAGDYARELKSTFPYEYVLTPARSLEDFQALSGRDLLQGCSQPDTLAEVERFETEFGAGFERCYLPGAWGTSPRGNEQIWRALAGANQPTLLSIMLRPEPMHEQDIALLLQIAQDIQKSAASPPPTGMPRSGTGQLAAAGAAISRQEYIRYAARQYNHLAAALHRPYLVQIHLAAPDGLPEYLPRAIGSALTHSEKPEADGALVPGYQVTAPQNPAHCIDWTNRMHWLEPDPGGTGGIDPRFQLLRRLVDIQEAHVLFRWPFPPENGLPDVEFVGLTA